MLAAEPRAVGSDTWLLLAVAYAEGDGRGGDLSALGFVAGLIRQAEFTDEELRAALGRLRAAGLVHDRDGTYHPAESIQAFVRARTYRRGVRHDYEDLIRLLGVNAPGGSVSDPTPV
jgi:hypothetical protein